MRNSLVAALVASADRPMKPQARRFLQGLSSDELQFIAGYLGACILESAEGCARTGAEWAEQGARFQRPRPARTSSDRELKMILLREYLRRAGVQKLPLAPRAGHVVH